MRLIDADGLTNEVIHDMAIAALHSNVKYFPIANDIVVAFRETIDNAPTIDAEPVKHGEWIFRTNIYIGKGTTAAGYVCSECGADMVRPQNYCPNCGAKMKGQEE